MDVTSMSYSSIYRCDTSVDQSLATRGSNLLELAILGLLKEQELHGYELKKRLAERMLKAEMDHHLGMAAEEEAGNHRNGYGACRAKTVLTDTSKLELAIPRDRHRRFDLCHRVLRRAAREDPARRPG